MRVELNASNWADEKLLLKKLNVKTEGRNFFNKVLVLDYWYKWYQLIFFIEFID